MKKKITKLIANILFFILPKKILNFIAYLDGYRYFKISYSQSAEDLILLKYLEYRNIKKGKYLDIGAFHPRWISNTHLLHKKGFSGYCIDLDEEKLRWFKFARGEKVKTICGAVSDTNEKFINFYKFIRKSPFSAIDTCSLENAEYFKKKTNMNYEITKVRNYHINEIFMMVGKIDVLNIDIEGKDFEFLKSSNLEIADPEIVLIEDQSSYFAKEELVSFFKKKNYNLLSTCGLTKIFAKKKNI